MTSTDPYAGYLAGPPHPAAAVTASYNHVLVSAPAAGYRDAGTAPLRKLSVDLIKTYKFINEVSELLTSRSAGAGNVIPTRQRELENVGEFDLSGKVGENAKLAGKVRNCTSLGRKCASS